MNLRAPHMSRRSRAITSGLVAALAGGLLVAGSLNAPAADDDPAFEVPATGETTPSDLGGDTVDDVAIWVDPNDPTRSVVLGSDHDDYSLSVYDLSGERLHKLPLDHSNNVDLRPGFSLGGQNVAIIGLAGSGKASFYQLDPVTRKVRNVTPGGSTLSASDLGGGGFYAHGMCMYKSPVDGAFYAFVVDNHGLIRQFEITDGGNGKVAYNQVREIDIEARPAVGNLDQSEACVADEVTGSLFVAEQDWHIWRYGAEVTDPTGVADRVMVDEEVSEGGHFTREAEGLAVVHGAGGESYLMASSQKAECVPDTPGHGCFTVYRATAPYEFVHHVKVVPSATADGCENTDGIDAVAANLGPAFPQGIFVCQDNDNALPAGGKGHMNFKYVPLETMLPAGFTAPGPTNLPPTTQPPTTQPPDAQPPTTQPPTTQPPTTQPEPQTPMAQKSGYWMLGAGGRIYAFGNAMSHGDAAAAIHRPTRAVDLEPTPGGNGYWVLDDQGHVYPHGNAGLAGSLPAEALTDNEAATSLSTTPSGAGYWIFTSRGRAFAFGDAVHHGDMDRVSLNGPVLDSIATPSGAGYYMVASDGGIFAFGDARYLGSMGGVPLNAPVESLVPDPDGTGYWLVASDGGVFAFEAGFRGSMGEVPLNKPITGMVAFGAGYLMVGEDGGIFNFSDQPFAGSLGDDPPTDPITSVAILR